MNDNEINELLATKVMGWKIGAYQNEKWWFETDTESYSWRPYKVSDWQPLTNISQALMCAEKWLNEDDYKRGYAIVRSSKVHGCYLKEWNGRAWKELLSKMEDTKERAICLALCEAVKE